MYQMHNGLILQYFLNLLLVVKVSVMIHFLTYMALRILRCSFISVIKGQIYEHQTLIILDECQTIFNPGAGTEGPTAVDRIFHYAPSFWL